jgi:hypothetical protein
MTLIWGLMNPYWFAPPLVVAISLVYAASRHESWPRIWSHAARLAGSILGVLVLAMAVLLLINSQL